MEALLLLSQILVEAIPTLGLLIEQEIVMETTFVANTATGDSDTTVSK
jgi:hypothetical protein